MKKLFYSYFFFNEDMMEMVDMLDLGSNAFKA